MTHILVNDMDFVYKCLKNYIAETGYPITDTELVKSVDWIIPIELVGADIGIFGVKDEQSDILGKVGIVSFVYVAKQNRRLVSTIVKYIYNYLNNKNYDCMQAYLSPQFSMWYIKKLHNYPMSYLHLTNIKEVLNHLEVT